MLGERCPEPLEVACAKRDRPASRRAPGRVGEANELVSLGVGQELHDRREALLARTLLHGQLFDHLGLSPWGCGLGHATDGNGPNRASVCRNVPNSTLGGRTCRAYAYAYQYVITKAGPIHLSPAGQTEIAAMRAEIEATAASGLSFDVLTARLDELTAEFRAVIDRELMAAGAPVNASPTRSIDALSAS
jgi:hypothetical protein